jgi:hypothetical protein
MVPTTAAERRRDLSRFVADSSVASSYTPDHPRGFRLKPFISKNDFTGRELSASKSQERPGDGSWGAPFWHRWEQASHNGDLVHAVEARVLDRDEVTQLGDVLAGSAEGRTSERDITVFDSTGLAIQDLAIALAALEGADELDLAMVDIG